MKSNIKHVRWIARTLCSHSHHKNVIKSTKQLYIYHMQTMHNQCRQRQQTTHKFGDQI